MSNSNASGFHSFPQERIGEFRQVYEQSFEIFRMDITKKKKDILFFSDSWY